MHASKETLICVTNNYIMQHIVNFQITLCFFIRISPTTGGGNLIVIVFFQVFALFTKTIKVRSVKFYTCEIRSGLRNFCNFFLPGHSHMLQINHAHFLFMNNFLRCLRSYFAVAYSELNAKKILKQLRSENWHAASPQGC